MRKIKFIGGPADGEVIEIDRDPLPAYWEWVMMVPPNLGEINFEDAKAMLTVTRKVHPYRLENLHGYGKSYYVYVSNDISPEDWLGRMIEGYGEGVSPGPHLNDHDKSVLEAALTYYRDGLRSSSEPQVGGPLSVKELNIIRKTLNKVKDLLEIFKTSE